MSLRTFIVLAALLSGMSWLIQFDGGYFTNTPNDRKFFAVLGLSTVWVIVTVGAFRAYGKRAWPILLAPPALVLDLYLIAMLWYACAWGHDCI